MISCHLNLQNQSALSLDKGKIVTGKSIKVSAPFLVVVMLIFKLAPCQLFNLNLFCIASTLSPSRVYNGFIPLTLIFCDKYPPLYFAYFCSHLVKFKSLLQNPLTDCFLVLLFSFIILKIFGTFFITNFLLFCSGLGTFEITVEHETATGLTTEVESKWSHGGKAADAR